MGPAVGGSLPLMITGMVVQSIGIGPLGGLSAIMAMQAVLTETAGEFGLAMGRRGARRDRHGGRPHRRRHTSGVGGRTVSSAIRAATALIAAALIARLEG